MTELLGAELLAIIKNRITELDLLVLDPMCRGTLGMWLKITLATGCDQVQTRSDRETCQQVCSLCLKSCCPDCIERTSLPFWVCCGAGGESSDVCTKCASHARTVTPEQHGQFKCPHCRNITCTGTRCSGCLAGLTCTGYCPRRGDNSLWSLLTIRCIYAREWQSDRGRHWPFSRGGCDSHHSRYFQVSDPPGCGNGRWPSQLVHVLRGVFAVCLSWLTSYPGQL